jgi:hypothetical protein
MDKIIVLVVMLFSVVGCVATSPSVKKSESAQEQITAAKKVVGALAPTGAVVEKYSPVTGKHYTGTLEFEPGTGVKLIPVEE